MRVFQRVQPGVERDDVQVRIHDRRGIEEVGAVEALGGGAVERVVGRVAGRAGEAAAREIVGLTRLRLIDDIRSRAVEAISTSSADSTVIPCEWGDHSLATPMSGPRRRIPVMRICCAPAPPWMRKTFSPSPSIRHGRRCAMWRWRRVLWVAAGHRRWRPGRRCSRHQSRLCICRSSGRR